MQTAHQTNLPATARISALAAGLFAVGLLSAITAGPAAADATARYTCKDGTKLTAAFVTTPGSVTLTRADGSALTLPQVVSADGGRYADASTEFWIKGQGASLTIAGKATTCTTKD